MGKKIRIVGAVALGPKVACRIRRLDPEAEITLIDKDTFISYGGCGIPYFVSGDIPDVDALFSTSYHAVRDKEFFRGTKRVDVMTGTEVTAIDRAAKTIHIKDVATGKESDLDYDTLVLGMGSTPFVPPVPGVDLPGVITVSNLHHAVKIKDMISQGQVESAVVVGGGAIGIEMAEALSALWGVETTIVEMLPQLLPQALAPDLALQVEAHLEENEITVLTGETVTGILGDEKTGVTGVTTGSGEIDCQLVIFGVGARPNTALAREAGLALGCFGGILTDARMRTSDPNIYAGGDCVETRNLLTGACMHLPLGSMANRQGRVIGTNVAGGNARLEGAVGTFCLKAFELGVARAGLTMAQAKAAGFDPAEALVVQADRAHFYPGNKLMYMRLIADRKNRQVLGIEAVGLAGDAVKARVDAVAAILPYKPQVEDISCLEVGYAPPYASAMDIVNTAGNVLANVIDGMAETILPAEFIDNLKTRKVRVLDVRSTENAEPCIKRYGKDFWLNITQEDLLSRLDEVPKDEPLIVFCNTGTRSYECQIVLRHNGFPQTVNVQGGAGMVRAMMPEF